MRVIKTTRNGQTPSKEWNSSIAVEKDRRPTLRHTVFDEHHTYEHPYQPKPFVPIPREIIQHSGIGSEKNLPHLYKREIDQRLLEMKEQEEREEREESECNCTQNKFQPTVNSNECTINKLS